MFFWTPPHFWALAMKYTKDYAAAKIPMLPVVKGERETTWNILLYTLLLFAITLLLFPWPGWARSTWLRRSCSA